MYRKWQECPYFENVPPICPYLLVFRVGSYVLLLEATVYYLGLIYRFVEAFLQRIYKLGCCEQFVDSDKDMYQLPDANLISSTSYDWSADIDWTSFIFFCVFSRNYMNDSLRTDVFVRYKPETVACACVALSARQIGVSWDTLWHTCARIWRII